MKKRKNIYPPGFDQQKASALARYYDSQSEKDIIGEINAAAKDPDTVMVQVPRELFPAVMKLIDKRKKTA